MRQSRTDSCLRIRHGAPAGCWARPFWPESSAAKLNCIGLKMTWEMRVPCKGRCATAINPDAPGPNSTVKCVCVCVCVCVREGRGGGGGCVATGAGHSLAQTEMQHVTALQGALATRHKLECIGPEMIWRMRVPCKGRWPQPQMMPCPRGDSREELMESARTAPPCRGCKPHLRWRGRRAMRFTAVPLRSSRRGQGRSCKWISPAGVTWVLDRRSCTRLRAGHEDS